MTALVTKWSQTFSDRISQDVVNPPSSCLFQPGHHMRIRVDGEGYRGVSERRLDDRQMHVGRQQRGGKRVTEAMERSVG